MPDKRASQEREYTALWKDASEPRVHSIHAPVKADVENCNDDENHERTSCDALHLLTNPVLFPLPQSAQTYSYAGDGDGYTRTTVRKQRSQAEKIIAIKACPLSNVMLRAP